jgi:Ca2+-binding RTX toxin-like protein
VALTGDGGTLTVGAGVYETDLVIDKSLTLLGAKNGLAGVDAARGTGETVITGDENAYASSGKVTVTADNVTIDGFTFDFASGPAGNTTGNILVVEGANAEITNNRFTSVGPFSSNQAVEIALRGTADGTTVSDNYIVRDDDSNQPLSGGIEVGGPYAVAGPSGVVISDNVLDNAYIDARSPEGAGELTITGNDIVPPSHGLAIAVQSPDYNSDPLPDGFVLTASGNGPMWSVESFESTTSGGINFYASVDAAASAAADGSVITPVDNPGFEVLTVQKAGDGDDTLIGGDGAFALVGGDGDDTLQGGDGDDALIGGDGNDAAVFAGGFAGYALATTDNGWTVTGASGADLLGGIETVTFNDATVRLVGNGGYATIQAAIDAAEAGDTILVADGTYDRFTVTKSLTLLSADGADGVVVNGVGVNQGWGVRVESGVDNVTLGSEGHGFTVNAGSGDLAAVYVVGGNDGVIVEGNMLDGGTGHALLTGGGVTNSAVTGNTLAADGPNAVAYNNGATSVGAPSDNVDFVGNTFTGGDNAGLLLGVEAANSDITGNTFNGESGYAQLELWGENANVSGNVFAADGGIAILDSVAGHDDAQLVSANEGVIRIEGHDDTLYSSIQAAIDAAAEGDTIHVGAGTYTPSLIEFDPVVSANGFNHQILVNKAGLKIIGTEGARIEVALPETTAFAARTLGFMVAANDVTISGFEIVGPLGAYQHDTTDFATLGYNYGIMVDRGVLGTTLTDNTIHDVRTGMSFEKLNGDTVDPEHVTLVADNTIYNTRGAFLIGSEGIVLENNTFGEVGNEWDLTLLEGVQPADYFADPLADPAAYGDAMMALSAANNGMTIADRLYGQGGVLTVAESDPEVAAQLAEIANRSHVDVLLGASNEPDAAVGESRGNGFGNPRLPMGTLQDAVDVVVKGGVVSLHDGDYGGEGIDGVVTITTEGLTLTGGAGAENVTVQLGGGVMNVSLLGEAGYQAFGNELDNILSGGEGADLLFGGDGNDTLAGGGGDDVFAFMADDSGIDTVTDFEEGDALDFSDILSDANDLIFEDHAESGGTQISYEGEAIAIVQSVTPDSLTVDDSGNVVLTPPA